MTLASLLHLTQTQPLVHAAIDWAAYATAGRVYLYERQRAPIARSRLDQGLLLGATIFGAALGAIGLHLLEIALAIGSRPLPEVLGKSILGGLLGGTLGTEIAKRAIHWPHSTGDAWVPALVAGLAIGRLGCQLAGTWDQTYGSPTGSSLG